MSGLAVALAALVAVGGSGGAYYYFEVYKKKVPLDASGANTATIKPVTTPASFVPEAAAVPAPVLPKPEPSGGNPATISPVTTPAPFVTAAPTPTPPPAVTVPKTSAAPTAVSYTSYREGDFVVWSTSGDVDLPGNPLNDSHAGCERSCAAQAACVGFSRRKGAFPGDVSDCYLQKRLSPQAPGDSTWRTFIKP